jgi:hypothetical protein
MNTASRSVTPLFPKPFRIAETCCSVGSHESNDSASLRRKVFIELEGLDLEVLGLTQILVFDKDEEFVTGLCKEGWLRWEKVMNLKLGLEEEEEKGIEIE